MFDAIYHLVYSATQMEKLLKFINALPAVDRPAFFKECRTTEGYLRKACSKGAPLGAEMCTSIERACAKFSALVPAVDGREINRKYLLPDRWAAIWPELVDDGRRTIPDRRKTA